jgi:hypothetical protein
MKKTMPTVLALLLGGCGGDGGTNPTPVLSVGGTYEVQKTVTVDGCGGAPGVFSNPATVRHTPGASTIVLNDHGTRDLPGTIASDGSFQLAVYRGPALGVEGVDTYDPGAFRTNGFAMHVTTIVRRSEGSPPQADCTVLADWLGTKQGAPNVIP